LFNSQDGVVGVSVKIDSLHKVFRNVKQEDIVTLQVETDTDDLKIIVHKGGVEARSSSYRIAQIILDQDKVMIPDREYPCEALIPTSLLVEICQELKGVGDTLKLSIAERHLSLYASDEVMKLDMTIKDRQVAGFGILCSSPYAQKFKCAYFIKMGKAAKITHAPECILQIGPDSPLSLIFQLENMGHLQFFLAPLIDEDEDVPSSTNVSQ